MFFSLVFTLASAPGVAFRSSVQVPLQSSGTPLRVMSRPVPYFLVFFTLELVNSDDPTLNFLTNNTLDALLAVEIAPQKEFLLCFNCKLNYHILKKTSKI